MVPTHMFLTRGVGVHKEKLTSFEEALRSAGVEYCNLVSVSSILPPRCKAYPLGSEGMFRHPAPLQTINLHPADGLLAF